MTLIALTDCCRKLSIDPKTFRRWVKQAQLSLQPHPTDGRSKGLCPEQLEQVATAHRRTLVPCQTQPPPQPAKSRPDSARASAAEPALPENELLSGLLAQLSTVQEQLSRLSQQLEQQLSLSSSGPVHPAAREEAAAVVSPPVVLPAASKEQQSVQEILPRPPAQVLPLVEYGRDGHYVVICPKEGRLSFEPDSPEWFAWLESRSSFRFVGKEGRFTAHRESDRLPNAVWRAHRKIRNHTYNQRLAHTPALTIRVLEQAAATLQAHLK
jgi:transposase-like protein